MKYPMFLKEGDVIGVTAPSSGITDELKIRRFNNARKKLNEKGYKVVFTDNVFTADGRGCSSDGKSRAAQLNELVEDDSVKAIISAAGGDYLMEMLEYVDYDAIMKNPKWIQGYSDNTGLLYSITTKCDIPTIYGFNFGDFGMDRWQTSVSRGLSILEGKESIQKSFEYYENERHEYVTGLEGYYEDEKVCWLNGRNEGKIEIKGRLLGGCLDVISFITGTPYDGTLKFIEKYKEDGILWYFESFDMNDCMIATNLWRLKQMGYFEGASGFVFGRPLFYDSFIGRGYEEAVLSILGDFDVPIIFNADIGHKGPQFSMINGVLAAVESENGKGSVKFGFTR